MERHVRPRPCYMQPRSKPRRDSNYLAFVKARYLNSAQRTHQARPGCFPLFQRGTEVPKGRGRIRDFSKGCASSNVRKSPLPPFAKGGELQTPHPRRPGWCDSDYLAVVNQIRAGLSSEHPLVEHGQQVLAIGVLLRWVCVFQTNLDTDSTRSWTVIPRQAGHRFQSKLDSQP